MDGILNILKSPGMTSFDVVSKVKRLCKMKKVGHTGTLDPDAVGVLPICLGKATRMVEFLMEDHKFYRGEITLGIETDTLDAAGVVTRRVEVGKIDVIELQQVLDQFVGKVQQIPPMVSAVKHKGKRLYELARKGIEVERKPRNVEIYALNLLKVDLDTHSEPRFMIDVECSKGTYIRTLAHDIGQVLGCGAHLSYLVRTSTGLFALEESVTLDELQDICEAGKISDIILPIDCGIRSMPKILIKDQAMKKAVNGVSLQKRDYLEIPLEIKQGDLVRVYGLKDFISISKVIDIENLIVKPLKVFA
ncbi:MAG: tRNA pseudouridine(55) synthase TruB [Halanaerobiales bacterium]|nr:tRNA pseudouridine(55) synthase TruB [Halanaerobiales bacterium]